MDENGKPETAVKLGSLVEFFGLMRQNKVPSDQVLFQLDLYAKGIRDSRLMDAVIVLIDGEVQV